MEPRYTPRLPLLETFSRKKAVLTLIVEFVDMFGVFINVASSSSNPNGRGRVSKDLTFQYLPIPEEEKTVEKVATYRDLGFTNVRFPDLPVHLDPEFETFTYGHVRRGFGDIRSLLRLRDDENGVLFFYATLQRDDTWSSYTIGYFKNPEIYDCRKLSREEIIHLKVDGFSKNAHLKRADPTVDFLTRGREGSRLLEKAFPMSDDRDSHMLKNSLKDVILTATGKNIKSGTPWFRWTLTCNDSSLLLDQISQAQK